MVIRSLTIHYGCMLPVNESAFFDGMWTWVQFWSQSSDKNEIFVS